VRGMKMKIIVAVAWLGLLTWAEPAGAQNTRTYSLTIGRHKSVALTNDDADKILAEASKALRKCNVVFKRQGAVGTFNSSKTPAHIETAADRDAVNKESFDIKVVAFPIDFCRVSQMHQGCAWDPPPSPARQLPQRRSIIVTDLTVPKIAGRVWAHEFGHRTGLPHRTEKTALMACSVPMGSESGELNEHECKCFRGGPGSCNDPIETAELCGAH
jgi:hypothetical protein